MTNISDTDFVASGGAGNHAWSVLRSEADEILFRHAGESGAEIFDGVKVSGIEFATMNGSTNARTQEQSIHSERPVSATWARRDGGGSGTIRFQYLVDASGRVGVVSTRYMKNRRYNQGLKSMATWGYWKGAGTYGPGKGDPFSEAITGTF